jgi:cytochrome P450
MSLPFFIFMDTSVNITTVAVGVATLTAFLCYWYKDDAIGAIAADPKAKRPFGHLPLLGSTIQAQRTLEHLHEGILEMFDEDYRRGVDPRAMVFSIPGRTATIVNDPESLEYVLSTKFESFIKGQELFDRFGDIFGKGIFASDGKQWYKQRKLASKIFTTNRFKETFQTVFRENIDILMGILESNAVPFGSNSQDAKLVDVFDLMTKYFLDSFGMIAFGLNLKSMIQSTPFSTAFDNSQVAISQRFTNPFWKITELFNPSLKRDMKAVREFGHNVIAQRRGNTERRDDLLQLFMEYKDEEGSLSDEELVDQVTNFLIAGRDTTAQAVSWSVYCLTKNPGILEKLLDECHRVMGDAQIPSYEQVKQLRYANAVFKEALRLYPSVPFETKMCIVDEVLPNGIEVKKGTSVTWCTYALGRNPNIWPDPLAFKPERFLGEKQPSPYQFNSFLGGPRVCLGKTLAELQGVFVLVSMLKNFDLQIHDIESVQPLLSLTFPMKNGMKCRIVKRK